VALDVSEALAAACPGTDHLRQTLGEDPAWAVGVGAAEPARLHLDSGDATLAGQVSQRAGVVAVHVIRKITTAWAGTLCRSGLGYDSDAIGDGRTCTTDRPAGMSGNRRRDNERDQTSRKMALLYGRSRRRIQPAAPKVRMNPRFVALHEFSADSV
jgi:hypothetical protein